MFVKALFGWLMWMVSVGALVLAWREADGLLTMRDRTLAQAAIDELIVRQETLAGPLEPLLQRYPAALTPSVGASLNSSSMSLTREIILSRPLLAVSLLAYPAWTILIGLGARVQRSPEKS